MFTVSSQTVTEDYKSSNTPSKEWKFAIANGNTLEITISDALLDSESLAEERALSEFLKQSYRINEVRFKTLLTNLELNQTINVLGTPFLVKGLNTTVTKTSIKTSVRAVRYE